MQKNLVRQAPARVRLGWLATIRFACLPETAALVAAAAVYTALLAQIYYDHTVFLIVTPRHFSQLRALLQHNRIESFSYLTAQPWGSDRGVLERAGLQCGPAAPLPFALWLLDCGIAR